MILTLKFYNLPPMPTNRAKTLVVSKGRPMLIKTPLAREFEYDIATRMKEYEQEITNFKVFFEKCQNYIRLEFFAYCPSSELFTKNGGINSKCPDFDSTKLMIDAVFTNMKVNDKYVKDCDIRYAESYDEFWNYILIMHTSPVNNLRNSLL